MREVASVLGPQRKYRLSAETDTWLEELARQLGISGPLLVRQAAELARHRPDAFHKFLTGCGELAFGSVETGGPSRATPFQPDGERAPAGPPSSDATPAPTVGAPEHLVVVVNTRGEEERLSVERVQAALDRYDEAGVDWGKQAAYGILDGILSRVLGGATLSRSQGQAALGIVLRIERALARKAEQQRARVGRKEVADLEARERVYRDLQALDEGLEEVVPSEAHARGLLERAERYAPEAERQFPAVFPALRERASGGEYEAQLGLFGADAYRASRRLRRRERP